MSLANGVTTIAAAGIYINANGSLLVDTAGALTQATVNANIYDNFGGNLVVGAASAVGQWAALTVNGNVDIENGQLTMSVGFDQNGNLSNYDFLRVNGQFAVTNESGEWSSTLSIYTTLTNNVQPVAGQVIGIVSESVPKALCR